MIPLKKVLTSTLGQKYLMALSGIGLVAFTIIHLLGNLSLYKRDGSSFNLYANTLDSFGLLLTIAEVGLLIVFSLHIVTAIWVTRQNRTARDVRYAQWKSKNYKSKEAKPSNSSSRNMFIGGSVILGFLILHICQFRFGPRKSEGYVAVVNGHEVDDLHRLVSEIFSNPFYVAVYVIAMVFLGLHLRHGFWSALQSAGIMKASASRLVHFISLSLAVVLSVGFLLIPIWMYFGLSGANS